MGVSDRHESALYFLTIPNSNVALLGFDLKYAFDELRKVRTAIRIHFSKLLETHDVDLDVMGLGLSASKKIGLLTS